MSWATSHAIEVFAVLNNTTNALPRNTTALMELILKGFRRYQTKQLIKKFRTNEKMQKDIEVEL